MRTLGVLMLVATVFTAAAPMVDAQCAMCRTALESSDEGGGIAEKLNEGILVLLGAPFGVAALIGVAIARSRRRWDRT